MIMLDHCEWLLFHYTRMMLFLVKQPFSDLNKPLWNSMRQCRLRRRHSWHNKSVTSTLEEAWFASVIYFTEWIPSFANIYAIFAWFLLSGNVVQVWGGWSRIYSCSFSCPEPKYSQGPLSTKAPRGELISFRKNFQDQSSRHYPWSMEDMTSQTSNTTMAFRKLKSTVTKLYWTMPVIQRQPWTFVFIYICICDDLPLRYCT